MSLVIGDDFVFIRDDDVFLFTTRLSITKLSFLPVRMMTGLRYDVSLYKVKICSKL